MAPLSIIPGRVRYETSSLVGQQHVCRFLERKVAGVAGVLDVAASHRTGRILVKFDESRIDRAALSQHLETALESGQDLAASGLPLAGAQDEPRPKKISSFRNHLLLDVVAHAILPKPFDILVPTMVSAFHK